MDMSDEKRRAVREALGGDPDVPVELATDEAGGTTGEAGHELTVSTDEVVEQLEKHDPMLLELLALRAAVGRLQG